MQMEEWTENHVERSLQALDRYFMGTHEVHKTAQRLVKLLNEAGIDHALAGALALNVHGVMRATEDVDILITREGLARFKELWLGRGYVEVRSGGKPVRDAETKVKIDFLIAGDYPGDGKPKPVAFPEPRTASVRQGDYCVLSLSKFVELKLASGMTAKDRPGDFQDVIRLIRSQRLGLDFAEQLDPYVREKYRELWDAATNPVNEDY